MDDNLRGAKINGWSEFDEASSPARQQHWSPDSRRKRHASYPVMRQASTAGVFSNFEGPIPAVATGFGPDRDIFVWSVDVNPLFFTRSGAERLLS